MASGSGTPQPTAGDDHGAQADDSRHSEHSASDQSSCVSGTSSTSCTSDTGSSAASTTTSTARTSPPSSENTAVDMEDDDAAAAQTPPDDNASWGDDPSLEEFIQSEQPSHEHDTSVEMPPALSHSGQEHIGGSTSMQWLNRLIQKYGGGGGSGSGSGSGTAHSELGLYTAHWNNTLQYYQHHRADDDVSSSSGVSDYGTIGILQPEHNSEHCDIVEQSILVDAPATLDPFECEWRSLLPICVSRRVVLPPPPLQHNTHCSHIGAHCRPVVAMRTKAARRLLHRQLDADMPPTPMHIVHTDWRIEMPIDYAAAASGSVCSQWASANAGGNANANSAIGLMVRRTAEQVFTRADSGTVPYEMHVALAPLCPLDGGGVPLPDVSIQVRPSTGHRRCYAHYTMLPSDAVEPATPVPWQRTVHRAQPQPPQSELEHNTGTADNVLPMQTMHAEQVTLGEDVQKLCASTMQPAAKTKIVKRGREHILDMSEIDGDRAEHRATIDGGTVSGISGTALRQCGRCYADCAFAQHGAKCTATGSAGSRGTAALGAPSATGNDTIYDMDALGDAYGPSWRTVTVAQHGQQSSGRSDTGSTADRTRMRPSSRRHNRP